ncbi:SDR family oxidoreductase [Nocardia salmonicida]|uniref:SDR family oxidoreductase n=1 Tax=Nocardia salmonicida TaxID=53431 RepID=UPI0033E7E2AF
MVFLSSQGAAPRADNPGYARTVAFEKALAASDLEWTAVRPAGFASNTFAWIEPVRTQRMVPAPFGDIGLPVVALFDIAAVVVAALREDGHHAQAYTVTGPAAITPREQAAALAAALGEPLRFVELTREQARANMLDFMPESVAVHTLSILGEPTPKSVRSAPTSNTSSAVPPPATPSGRIASAARSADKRGLEDGIRSGARPAMLLYRLSELG